MGSTKIQRRFDRSAAHYDQFSGLHRVIADKLFDRVSRESQPSALLDVGCGTGYLTGKLKEHFPQSKIIGLDFSAGMIKVAGSRNNSIAWVLADNNNLPFSDGEFSLLVSNLAYQWSEDLFRSFSEAWRVLAPGASLSCTLFGYHTCQELFYALNGAKAKDLQFNRLPNEAQVRGALTLSGFKDPQIQSERIPIGFSSMYELIYWLKSIGANNLSYEGYLGPAALSQASSIYNHKFPYAQGVEATFEVIWAYVKK